MRRTRVSRATLASVAATIAIAVAAAAPAAGSKGTSPREIAMSARSDRATPRPPRLPLDFRARGSWVVEDLGIRVPFTWQGRNGNSRMVAGGPGYRIWFVNLIYRNALYTLTRKWPGLHEHPCSRIPGRFNLRMLNQGFRDARFVGREILQGRPPRYVNHWRVGAVWPQLPPGNHLRIPLALADIYVDQSNRGTFWQVLLFGLPNLYDPELDEWGMLDTFRQRPGRVVRLPARC